MTTHPPIHSPETSNEMASPRKRFYRPELDALRFLAFLMVFLHHVVPPDGSFLQRTLWGVGGFGMQIFFILSSFLIVTLLLKEKEQTGSVHLKAFYLRRILRIWPLYFGVIVAVVAAGIIVTSLHVRSVFLLSLVTFWANWYICLGYKATEALAPLWSISLEEHFYFVCPAACQRFSLKAIALLSLSTIAISLVATPFLAAVQNPSSLWFNEIIQLQYFGSGAFLALWFHHRQKERWNLNLSARVWLIVAAATLAVLVSQPWGYGSPTAYLTLTRITLGYALINVCCSGLLVALIDMPEKLVPGFLRYLGKISYGLYVFHEPVLLAVRKLPIPGHALRVLAELICTIVVATLSYQFFELPFLRIKGRLAFVKSRDS